MGLYDIVKMDPSLGESFSKDKFEWNIEMRNKYLKSKIISPVGQILSRDKMFCKNASIFDLTGTKIWWGDLAPKDVEKLNGVYYILSEHKSYWDVPQEYVKEWDLPKDDFSYSPFRDLLILDPTMVDIKYIKNNALARIIDGKIQTNREIIFSKYS